MIPGQFTPSPSAALQVPRGPYFHERSGTEVIERYITGALYGDSEQAKLSEVEQWRKPAITLFDCPDPSWPRNQLKALWPEGKPEPAGLLVQCAAPQKPCFVYCHPGMWDTWCALFLMADYEVVNAGAHFTPHQT